MTKEMIKHKYRYESTISFQFAMQQLMALGFTEYAAEQYIWS